MEEEENVDERDEREKEEGVMEEVKKEKKWQKK